MNAQSIPSIDGGGNNSVNLTWGQAHTELSRLLPAKYADGEAAMMTGPNARDISNTISNQSGSLVNDRDLTDFVWAWGQFIDHDMVATKGGSTSAHIPVNSASDPLGPVIPFTRSAQATGTGTGTGQAAQQINEITSYLDGSGLYGSDLTRSNALRLGTGGLLKTSAGDLLPYNTMGLANDNPTPAPDALFFAAGDTRANENVGLLSMHTIFAREHNRLAADIALTNSGIGDQQIFERARALVSGQIQAITYNEFLPALGVNLNLGGGSYDPTVDASITTEFAAAGFRFGHSMISSDLQRFTDAGVNLGSIALADAFFRPDHFSTASASSTGTAEEIDYLMKGMSMQRMQEIDTQIVDDLRNALFGPPGSGGMDLAALNIQRGRDHGLGTFTEYQDLFGLNKATLWSDITSDPALQADLASLYSSVDEVELWVGLLAEDHLADASVGLLMSSILSSQFSSLMEGDSSFYLWDGQLSDDDRDFISKTTLSDVLTRNTGLTSLQGNVFFAPTVPEPSSLILVFLAGVVALRRRK